MRTNLLVAACASLALCGAASAQDGVLRITGAVARPMTLTRDEIAALPHQSVTASAHDQSGRFDGVIVPGEKRPAPWVRQVVSIEVR